MTNPVRGRCPHLGLRSDPETVFILPSGEHRCFAGPTPRDIDLAHQEAFCFTEDYPSCPWFTPVPTEPRPEVVAVPEPTEAAAVEVPAEGDASAAGLAGVPLLRALADRLGEWTQEVSLLEIVAWTAFGAFAVLFLYFFLVQPLGAPPPSPAPNVAIQLTPSPTPMPSPGPSPSAVPTLSVEVTARPVVQPTVAPGQMAYAINPQASAVGWVASGDLFNHFGDRNLHVGVFKDQTYHGAMLFDLAPISVGSSIEYAAVELMGLSSENLGAEGTWQLQMLAPHAVEKWSEATYTAIHEAAVAESIGPALTPGDLAARQVNVFEFSPAQRRELERCLEDGVVSFRLDGPAEGGDNLFTWDTGYGDGGFGNRPILRLVIVPPPTPTLMVVTPTATPENVVTLAAILATATYEATTTGTPAPPPPNMVTPTPPFIVTNTPRPASAATAIWLHKVATAQAFVYGTPAPLPAHAITATPVPTGLIIVTPTATPENVVTLAAILATATYEATTTGTPTPPPPNLATPTPPTPSLIIINTPTPANAATAAWLDTVATAQAFVYGTPTSLPTYAITADLIIATLTATPENVVTLAAILATATYEATTTGTPTPPPPNLATPTPPFIITNTPLPGSEATAAWLDTVATAQAFVYGTPTPLPTYAVTATPLPLLEYLTPAPSATPTPTLLPVATPTAIPEILRGKIAFLSDRFGPSTGPSTGSGQSSGQGGEEPTVLVINPDGTGLARLNLSWAYYRALQLDTMSPDGEYRAVVRIRRESHPGGRQVDDPQIWIEKLADGTMSYLAGRLGGADYDPAWSPDGAHIAYVAQQDLNDEIYVVNRDTEEKRRLTANSWEWDKHPSWSPDGSQIVFWSNRETGRRQIWIMNADGSAQRRLLASDFNDWDPVWIK